MKKLFFFFLILQSYSIMAQGMIPVHSLNHDSCWVSTIEPGVIKTVNFGQKSTMLFTSAEVDKLTQEIMAQMSSYIEPGSYEIVEALLHCGDSRSSLVLNLKTDETRLCVWAIKEQDQFKVQRYGVEPYAHDGHCGGAVLGEAILTLNTQWTLVQEELILLAQKMNLGDFSAQEIIQGVYRVRFGESVYFKEEKIWQVLEEELKSKKLVRAFELNFYQYESGEFLPLDL